LDITNVFNTKRLNGSGLANYGEYLEYILEHRRTDPSLGVGDPSTFFLFSEPYRDEKGYWHAPLAPQTEWLHFLNPRQYLFGVRIDL
jgi:hypothetical protein